jgi:carbon-monoxide dehydrogenase large subunit
MASAYVGSKVLRVEDERLLRGRGRYIDDLNPAGVVHAAFVRSPHAHAKIVSVDLERARRATGVVGVFDGQALGRMCRPIRAVITVPGLIPTEWPVIGKDHVRFVGEAVAVVVARTRSEAEDALGAIESTYEPLPAVADVATALRPGARLVHADAGTNVLYSVKFTSGDVDTAFATADLVIAEKFHTQRATGVPIETRGYIAEPDPRRDGVVLWSSTQVPHIIRTGLAEILALDENRIRVVAPDVGGAFGVKGQLFTEEAVVCALARLLQRPVKWIETRREHLLASIHSREHHFDIEAAVRKDGRLLALRAKIHVDAGAYSVYPYTFSTEPAHAASLLPGPYDLQTYACEAFGVATNKCVIAPYRGVSRPTANFVTERVMDMIGRRLRLDPAAVRLRNLISDEQFPYRTVPGLVFDSGQYKRALRRALQLVRYDEFRGRQAQTRSDGRFCGIGMSIYVESTAGGSAQFLARGMPVAGYDMATVRVLPTAKVEVATSAASQGQGHETVFAQIAADALCVPLESVHVAGGDTELVPYGTGTFGSRSAVMSGGALAIAARAVREQATQIAASLLEVAAADVTLDHSGFTVSGTNSTVSWTEVARAAYIGTSRLPADMQRGLHATASHDLAGHQSPCSYGVHIAIVEVDPDTGVCEVVKYVIVEDCGAVLNPMIVEGQIHGAFAQGFGTATMERLAYDSDGQLLTGSLMDYALPRASDVASLAIEHLQTPSPYTFQGVKGMAEGASVAPPAALANAISDALEPLGVEITRLPLEPQRVWQACGPARG